MEKKREQELADQEALRLYREFSRPDTERAPGTGKASWTMVKEPPRASRSLEREER